MDSIEERKQEILARYARLGRKDRPMVCHVPPDAGDDDQGPRRRNPVMFPDAAQAEAAGRELQQLFGREHPYRAYPCPRSRSGHHHLTTSSSEYLATGGARLTSEQQ